MHFRNIILNMYLTKATHCFHLVLGREVFYTVFIFLYTIFIFLYLEYQKTTFRTDTKEAQYSSQYHRKTTF